MRFHLQDSQVQSWGWCGPRVGVPRWSFLATRVDGGCRTLGGSPPPPGQTSWVLRALWPACDLHFNNAL